MLFFSRALQCRFQVKIKKILLFSRKKLENILKTGSAPISLAAENFGGAAATPLPQYVRLWLTQA